MKIKTLSDQEVEKIHQATLTVLNETGVRFPSEKALKIFAEAGADVDFKGQIVKAMTEGLCINSDTLAVDEIMAVGPGGHFLDRDFTIDNIRQLWQPGITQTCCGIKKAP